jgi:CheY-like chemotaxis protein
VVGIAPDDRQEYRILVADDKWENRRLLVEWLQAVGFQVSEAGNGAEAIAEWERWAPQLIWMDMRMPVMDGYEATRRIKSSAQGQATVVIALTASAFEHEQAIVLSVGCDDFVRKPVRESTIFEKIAQHLGVEFIYDEPQAVTGSADSVGALTTAALAALPADLLASLGQAVEDFDPAMANAVIAQIRTHDAIVADGLAHLLANYRFDTIEALVQESSKQAA